MAKKKLLSHCADGVKTLKPYIPGKSIEELQNEYSIDYVVKLASNENLLGASIRAIKSATEANFDMGRYPDGNGTTLKNKLAEFTGFDARQIVLGNGSNDILDMVARAFLQPGRNAVFSEHAFAIYPIATQAVGADSNVVKANAENSTQPFGHNLSAFSNAVNGKTSVIFVANPNNPTGTWNTGYEIRTLLESVPSHVIVVIDEAYYEYAADIEKFESATSLVARFPNLVVTRTFSKAYGLAGLRIGYAICSEEVAEILNRVRHPFNNNVVATAAAMSALGDLGHLQRSKRLNRKGVESLEAGFKQRGLFFIPSIGNFVSFRLPSGHSVDDVYLALQKKGVIVRPIENYGLPGFIRVSVGLPDELDIFFTELDLVLGGK